MNRPRSLAVLLLVMSACMVSAVACDDRSPEPSRVVSPSLSVSRSNTSSARKHDAGREAKRRFHASNRHDWVGVAHNRAMDEFRARLRRGEIPRDMCNDLVAFMSAAERLPQDVRRSGGAREQRSRVARQALRTSHFCANRLADVGAGITLLLVQSSDVSPETHAMLNQIQGAAAVATTSGELAIALTAIVQNSAHLPNGESAVADAAASVAQSSMEYWEANLEATEQDYSSAYGACIGQYSSAEEAASACMGLSGAGGPAPTMFDGRRGMTLQLVRATYFGCNRVNRREIVGDDVKGGIIGGVMGFRAGLAGGPAAPATATAGALSGAAIGAAANSLATIGWQWLQETWCEVTGGAGGSGSGPAPT